MTIPVEGLYMNGSLGAGKPATTQTQNVNTETAGAPISYGQAVAMSGGKVVPANAAPIYGVALSRSYVDSEHFTDTPTDTWKAGDVLGVLREGTIAVPISADVNKNEAATVDANGLFKPAGDSDAVVGIFTTAGNSGDTAFLQTSLGYNSATKDQASSQPANTPTK
ncbi:hypothetical protein LASUN_13080 [Lentilactobacillus sunkii]|uniref:Uncharacterized protein n=1 Tax=Lentilactobacillus sunkii TaxID=481719 RepID=A0A1E7XCL9_9LACO|nr:hypothetical protein [Lentilactobacillus sunkii]OFA10758.1 hypothetical protein LASUN_13080 [Lentilactobacillus sunkii]